MQGRGRVSNNPTHPCPPSTEVENACCNGRKPHSLVGPCHSGVHVGTSQHATAAALVLLAIQANPCDGGNRQWPQQTAARCNSVNDGVQQTKTEGTWACPTTLKPCTLWHICDPHCPGPSPSVTWYLQHQKGGTRFEHLPRIDSTHNHTLALGGAWGHLYPKCKGCEWLYTRQRQPHSQQLPASPGASRSKGHGSRHDNNMRYTPNKAQYHPRAIGQYKARTGLFMGIQLTSEGKGQKEGMTDRHNLCQTRRNQSGCRGRGAKPVMQGVGTQKLAQTPHMHTAQAHAGRQ